MSAKKNTWIARVMAESAVAGNVMVFMLSYRNLPNGEKPLGARAFRYPDIQRFLKALREAYYRRYGVRNEISYFVAGERGSKGTKRVHWHIVLVSNKPLGVLGNWKTMGGKELDAMPLDQNSIWSLWPHGMVHPRNPDQQGVAYVMKYTQKDMFNIANSKGTGRESKADNHGSSKCVMSRNPPLGQRYIDAKLQEWRRRQVTPVSLNLKIPGYSGYWFVQGDMRERLLYGLHEINQHIRSETGRDALQWRALLETVSKEEQIEGSWNMARRNQRKSQKKKSEDLRRKSSTGVKQGAGSQKQSGYGTDVSGYAPVETVRPTSVRTSLPSYSKRKTIGSKSSSNINQTGRTLRPSKAVIHTNTTHGGYSSRGGETTAEHRAGAVSVTSTQTIKQPSQLEPSQGSSENLDGKAKKAPTCKKRPDSAEARKGSGGSRPFIPWCKKS
ncbi:MAG: hypothetical protein N4A70_06625 [Pelagimonas sp.]|nr:hypothetical protein [Pelagimonas sp.]